MGFYREGDRISCGYEPDGYSSLKKSGLLYRQWCLKCSHRCWLYAGIRPRWIETRHIP